MAGKYDKSYLEYLCEYEQSWRLLFTFSVGFLGIMVIWFFSIESGSPTYVVTVLNVLGLAALALLSGFVLSKCR